MPDDITLLINGQRVKQFSGFTFTRAMDSVGGGLSFNSPFFPGVKAYRDIFRPRSYQKVEAYIGSDQVFSGEAGMVTPVTTAGKTSVNMQCRSRAAVIVDCTFEKSDFPLQYSKAKLDEIAADVLEKYGISARFPDGPGALFEEAGPQSPTETVFSFLQNLARQRKLLIGDDPLNPGEVVFFRANAKKAPGATLAEGQQGVMVSQGKYDGTKSFSAFEVFGQERGKNDNYARVTDPTMGEVLRPKSIQANDTNAANIIDAANWAATSHVAASIDIPLSVEGWRREDGKLWGANEILLLTAPSIMVYRSFAFMVKSVTLQDLPKSQAAVLTLTMPNAYTGELPTRYPWDE